MYTLVKRVDVFSLRPLYILSSLTARFGIVWILYLDANFITTGISGGIGPFISLVLAFAQILFTVAAFVVPLLGIHRKIVEQKERSLVENAELLEVTYRRLQSAVPVEDYETIQDVKQGVDTQLVFRQEIERTPTWPWKQETIRGFLSAVFLPILIWLVQQLLSRVLKLTAPP